MTIAGTILAMLGAGVGYGLFLVFRGARKVDADVLCRRAEAAVRNRSRVGELVSARQAVAALAVGLCALVLTRWPMAFLLGAAAVLAMNGLSGRSGAKTIERLEAIAGWTEMLRDTLAGASGLTQALIATATTAPRAVRDEVAVLSARLSAGVAPEAALREFADDLADPAADTIAASLVMASRERAQRLGDLLGALAAAAREEVAMRLGVEASRASARTAVRMITGFSFGLFALMALFARSYLEPYGSATGQLVLGLVGVLFGLGLWLMSVMARPRPFPRLELAETAE